jgi:hypothetical protein
MQLIESEPEATDARYGDNGRLMQDNGKTTLLNGRTGEPYDNPITVGVVYTAQHGGLKLVPDGGDFSGVHWWALALYVPMQVATIWFRSVRWRFLLRSLVEVPKVRPRAAKAASHRSGARPA